MDIRSFNIELYSLGLGSGVSIDGEDTLYMHLGLPALYFFEDSAGLALEINSFDFEIHEDHSFKYSIINSKMYYSFSDSSQFILGPYISAGFEYIGEGTFISGAGFCFKYLKDSDIFSFIPGYVIRGVSLDVGYSLYKGEMYIKLTTDPLLFF